MKIVGVILFVFICMFLIALVPIGLVWTVKTWQAILADQVPILSWDAWTAGLFTLCLVDGMRRIKMPK